jgi:CIC family chloride channel protein
MKKRVTLKFELFVLRLGLRLFERLGEKNSLLVIAVAVGALSGLAAVALKRAVEMLHRTPELFHGSSVWFLVLPLPVAGLALAFLFQRIIFSKKEYSKSLSPLISSLGTGRPDMPARKTFSHLLTSGVAVGLGGSAGLEAPIVLTGAAIGSNTGGLLRVSDKFKTLLAACGGAAGISAIFNSPVAGALFAAEVLLRGFSVSSLIPILLASASAAVVSKVFYSGQLFIVVSEGWRFEAIPAYLLLGAVCALAGVYMIRASHRAGALIRKTLKTQTSKILAGGLLLSLMLALFPPLMGEGYSSVDTLLSGNAFGLLRESPLSAVLPESGWALLSFILAMILLKVISTSLTVDCGGDGGIFAPAMLTGALTGFAFARAVNLSGLAALSEVNFTAAAMCGVFTAVIRAPLTGIFLIAEVTGGYSLFIPLMIVSAVSFFVAGYFEPYSVYTRSLAEKGLLFDGDPDGAALSSVTAGETVDKNCFPLSATDSFRKIAEAVLLSGHSVFPVLDAEGRLEGVVLADSIRSHLADTSLYDFTLVSDVMEKPVKTLRSGDPASSAHEYFSMFRAESLPVTDQDGKFLGFVSKTGLQELAARIRSEKAPVF